MNNDSINIRIAKDADHERWDDFVLKHPEASPYHLFAWKKAIEAAYGHKCRYLYAEKNKAIQGVLPLVHLHFPIFKNEMVSLPFCDVGNCIADSDDVQEVLFKELFTLLKKSKVKNFQIRGDFNPTDVVRTQLKSIESGKVRMFLNLPGSADELFGSFKSKLRSQVRKAQKNGVSFRWGSLSDMDTAYHVFSKNMRELGSPVHSRSYIKAVLRQYGDRAKLGLAEFKGETIGMGIILLGGKGVSIPWASTLRAYNRLSPNMLLYWNALKYSADNGYAFFDFGRSSEGEGTYKFKKQWGAIPKPLIWYEYMGNGKDENNRASTDSRKREIAAAMWQKLPLGVANMIGPHIRKYISL